MKESVTMKSGERGVAMVLALMVLAMLTIMAMGALVTARRSIEVAGGERANMSAFYTADSGMNRAVEDVLDYYQPYGHFQEDWTTFNLNKLNKDDITDESPFDEVVSAVSVLAPSPYTRNMAYIDMGTLGSPTLDEWMKLVEVRRILFYTPTQTCKGEIVDDMCQGLYYEVWYLRPPSKRSIKILAMARNNDDDSETNDTIEAAIEYTLRVEYGDRCQNAIFANGQATGHAIDGNVEIHGSATILCSDPPADNMALELGGGASIYNDYNSSTAASYGDEFRTMVDSLPQDDYLEETLNAKVRIKTCGASLAGSSQFGTEDSEMDEVCVDGGITGGTIDSNVYALDGKIKPFSQCEGAADISWPDISDDTDPNYVDVLTDTLVPPDDWCTITSATTTMNWDSGGDAACTCPGGPNACTLCWDGVTNTLTSNSAAESGNMYDMSGCTSVALSDFTYDGKATFFYGSNTVKMDGDILATGSYPSADAMGFITTGNMEIGNTAQSHIMGLLYAEGTISIDKQTAIAGIVIAEDFSVKNVPEFYQVPELAQHAPAGFNKLCAGNERLADSGWRLVF